MKWQLICLRFVAHSIVDLNKPDGSLLSFSHSKTIRDIEREKEKETEATPDC